METHFGFRQRIAKDCTSLRSFQYIAFVDSQTGSNPGGGSFFLFFFFLGLRALCVCSRRLVSTCCLTHNE